MSCRRAMPLLLVLAAGVPLAADERPTAAPPYQEIRVPADELDVWLARGDWRAIGREAFDKLVRAAQPVERQPPDAWIARAVYTATLTGDVLESGRFTWDVRQFNRASGLLRLDPLGLAVEDLHWNAAGWLGTWLREPAGWGAARDGTLNLLVDRPAGRVIGQWNLRGRRIGRNTEFQVDLAPAAVSELRLDLPRGLAITASSGAVVRPNEQARTGTWRVVLGSETGTRLTIGPAEQMVAAAPLMLAETDTLCLAQRDGLRVQAGIRLEVLRSSVRTISVSLPADVQVYSVRYARETALAWKTSPQGRVQRLTIDLPGRLSGSSRSISIEGTAPAVFGEPAALPVPAVENALFQSGRIRLVVEKPLELRSYRLAGCREREALAMNGDRETIAFEQLRHTGRAFVTIDEAPVHLAARSLQLFEFEPETWRLRADVEWHARSGRTFSVAARLPPGWNVTHVRPANSTSSLVRQQTIAGGDGSRVLLEFHQAVDDNTPRRILIYAERPSPAAGPQPELPLVRPEGVTELETIVALPASSAARPRSLDSASLDPLPLTQVPAFAIASELWPTVAAADGADAAPWRVYGSQAPSPAGRLTFAGGDRPVEAPRPATHPGAGSLPSTPFVADAPASADLPGPAVATLELRSVLEGTDGFDLHRANYTIHAQSEPARISFRVPAGTELLGMTVGGTSVAVHGDTERHVLPVLAAGQRHELEVRYRSPAAQGFLRRSHSVPLLDAPLTIVRFDWLVATPAEWQVLDGVDGLVTQQDSPPLPWTKRVFGPLGRPGDTSAFNPLDPAEWRSVLHGAASTAPAANHSADGWPAGWWIWRGSAFTAPDSCTVVLWSAADAQTLAWVALLAALALGVLARTTQFPGRTRLGCLAAAACLLAAPVLPADLALVSGSVFSGVLLTCLVPRTFIRPGPRGALAGVRGTETTHSGPRVAAGTATGIVLTAVFLLSWEVFAQQPAAPPAEESARATLDSAVLVPVSRGGQPQGDLPVVYVSRVLLDRLEAAATQQTVTADYLIESAAYRGDVDHQQSIPLRAEFRIAVLSEQRPVRIELPIVGAFPAGTPACHVNGQPHPLLVGEDGRTLLIEWDTPPTQDAGVVFLHATLPLQAGRVEPPSDVDVSLQVPPAGRTSVELRFAEPQQSVEFLESAGRVELTAEGHRVRADLGRTSRLIAAWSQVGASATTATPLEIQSRIYTLVNVQPARLDYQSRIVCRLERGAVDHLEWRIPATAFVRHVVADDLAGHTVTHVSPDEARLTFEFARPREGEFHVDVALLLPVSGDAQAMSVRPILTPESLPGRQTIRVESREIGVAATTEFQVRATAPSGATVTEIPTAAFLQAFARTGEPPAGLREPLEAWRLAAAEALTVSLEPRRPSRRVRLQQTGALVEGEFRWTANAEVEIREAPAWRHSVLVDPRMIIDSVSVRHDEAERLVRWSRTDNRVELFLRDQSIGIQDVVVRGRFPIERSGATPLPLVRLEESTVLESRLQLYAAEDVSLDLDIVEGVTPDNSPIAGEATAETSGLVASGRYRLAPELAAAPQLRWRPRPPAEDSPPPAAAVTVFQPAATAGRWTARCWLRLPAPGGDDWRIRVPDAWAPGLNVESEQRHRAETLPAGGIELVVTGNDAEPGEIHELLLSTRLDAPSADEWLVSTPSPAAAPGLEHWLVIPSTAEFRTDSTPVPAPAWLPEQAGIDPASPAWRSHRSTAGEWRLVRRPERASSGVSAAPRLETAIHVTRGGQRLGRTTLTAEPGALPRVTFSWPADLRLRAAFADGVPAVVQSIVGNDDVSQIVVTRPGAAVMQEVTLYWERDRLTRRPVLGPLVQSLPAATQPRARESFVEVTPPGAITTLTDRRMRVPVNRGSLELRLWTFDRRWLVGALLLLGGGASVWASSRVARRAPGERLGRHPLAAVLLIGIIWWLCLVPGVLGFLLAVAAVLFGAGRLLRPPPEPAAPRQVG